MNIPRPPLASVRGDGFRDSTRHPEWEQGLADYDIRHRFVIQLYLRAAGWAWQEIWRELRGVLRTPCWAVGKFWGESCLPDRLSANASPAGSGVSNPRTARTVRTPYLGFDDSGSSRARPNGSTRRLFKRAAPGTFGNVGRNTWKGPARSISMSRIFKNFRSGSASRLQFRSEFFNLPNHPNFQGNAMTSTTSTAPDQDGLPQLIHRARSSSR